MSPLSEEDAPEVAGLMNEHGPERIDPSEIAGEWPSPKIDLGRDGRIGNGVCVLVEDIGEERGWRRAFTGGWSTNDELFTALGMRGYRRTRSSWRMEVPLDSTRAEPWSPDAIEIRALGAGEEPVAYEVHQESFEDTWEPIRWSYEEWTHAYAEPSHFERALWFLAWEGTDPCGGAICRRHATDLELGWVAVLGVDAESPTGANSLYDDVGMSARHRFDIYERVVA